MTAFLVPPRPLVIPQFHIPRIVTDTSKADAQIGHFSELLDEINFRQPRFMPATRPYRPGSSIPFSILVAFVGRQVLPATDTETAPSILWFATIQCIESKQ